MTQDQMNKSARDAAYELGGLVGYLKFASAMPEIVRNQMLARVSPPHWELLNCYKTAGGQVLLANQAA